MNDLIQLKKWFVFFFFYINKSTDRLVILRSETAFTSDDSSTI